MHRKSLPVVVVLAISFLGFPTPVKADDPVTDFVASYLLGKLVDEVWDSASGKPDVALLDQRLKELENNAVMRGEMRDKVRKLRDSINDRVTRDEFRKMAEKASTEIGSIKRRLDDLEERVEKLEVDNEDLKNGTMNAADAQFFVKRGERYTEEKNFNRAIANCNIAIRLDAKNASAYLTRSLIYASLGAPDVVVLDATKAVRLDPKNVRSHAICGWAYTELKQYTKAIDYCTKAIELDPKYANAYANRGSAYRDLEQYTRAIADLTKAIDLDPKDEKTYNGRGCAYANLKEYTKAIDDFTKAIDLDPKYARAYGNRAFAFEARGLPGDREQAQQDRQKAESLR